MQVEAKKYLYDVLRAAELVESFTAGKDIEDYEKDAMLQSAVERQFEIMGEALAKLARVDRQSAEKISDYRRIISFRNILIHGYADVDHRIVWDIAQSKLPTLRRETAALLNDL